METHQVSVAFCFNVQKNPCSGVGEKPAAKGYKNPIPFLGGVVTHFHQNLYIMKENPAHLSELTCNLQSFLII